MKIQSSEKLIELVKSMLNSATSSILFITYKMDQEVASEILLKAASGVETTIITNDRDWARWLTNQREAYKRDEEIKLNKELQRIQSLYSQILYFTIIISVLIVGLDSFLYFVVINRFIYYINIFLSIVVIVLLVYYGIKRRKSLSTQINILRENLQELTQEINQIREKIGKKLKIIEINKELTFSIISCDDKIIMSSAPLKFANIAHSLHIVLEISKDTLNQIIKQITEEDNNLSENKK
ncbi:MAG: hypothetical protein QW685_08445 [Saccharolobus sp.]